MPHAKLLKWKKNYHRFGVSHHYIGRDLREDKEFKFYLYPGRKPKYLTTIKKIGFRRKRWSYFPRQLKLEWNERKLKIKEELNRIRPS